MTSSVDGALSPEILQVAEQIAAAYHPLRIYLYNQRVGLRGNTTSFKLCAVLAEGDKVRIEQEIYLAIDSDVPFDVLLYTGEEWEELSRDAFSFAGRIRKTGVLLHGQD